MPKFGAESLKRLRTCDERLQRVLNEVIKDFDMQVIEGHRGEAAQNKAFAEGKSKLRWPNGKHCKYPSAAVDIAPYPVDWNDLKRFYLMAGLILATAKSMGIKLRWGAAWSGDLSADAAHPPKFLDAPHFEVID